MSFVNYICASVEFPFSAFMILSNAISLAYFISRCTVVSCVPDSLAVRRESGQTAYYVSCKLAKALAC